MTIIRVEPSLLQGLAAKMQDVGGGVSALGSNAASAAEGAPSYDGQFGPLVWPIGAEASSRTSGFTTQLVNLSVRLNLKAVEFERADNTTINGLNSTFMAWPTITDYLARWSKMTGIPVAALERYLKLGMLSGSSSFYGLLIGMVLANNLYSWTGQTFSNLTRPSWWSSLISSKATKYISVESELLFIGRQHKLWPGRLGRPPKNNPKLNIAAWKGEAWKTDITGTTKMGGVRLGGKGEIKLFEGEAGFGVRVGKGEAGVGGYAKVTGASAKASGIVGSKKLGIGGELKATAGEAELFFGVHEGRAGAKVGGKLISGEATVGMNVGGANVGVVGEIGIKFELGLEIGKKSKVYLGPFTIGLNIGEALGN